MENDIICLIVDEYLQIEIEQGVNSLPGKIDILMSDPEQDSDEEWRTWFPIESTVTDDEIIELQNQIGHIFPADYISFLKHKHFYELVISEASFTKHPVNTWRNEWAKVVYSGYPREYLIDRGLIPFADWSDWGLLCFNANDKENNNNYPIVIWDHETPYNSQYYSRDFRNMMLSLDKEDKENRD